MKAFKAHGSSRQENKKRNVTLTWTKNLNSKPCMNRGQAYVLLSNQKWISRAKGRNRFGQKKTTDAKFEYSKEERKKTGKLTCRSYLSECRRWSSDRWKSLCLSASENQIKPLVFTVFLCISPQPYAGSLGFFFTLSLRLSLLSPPSVFGLFSLFFFCPHSPFFFFFSFSVVPPTGLYTQTKLEDHSPTLSSTKWWLGSSLRLLSQLAQWGAKTVSFGLKLKLRCAAENRAQGRENKRKQQMNSTMLINSKWGCRISLAEEEK